MKSSIPFIIIAICISSYFVYIKPTIAVINQKKAKFQEYENVLNKVKEVKIKTEELSSKYSNISEDELSKLDKMIPEKFISEYFVNDLNAMAGRYGMRITQININVPLPIEGAVDDSQTDGGGYKTIIAKFVLSGKYDQLLSFLKDLETSLRIMDVTNLSVKAAPADKTKGDDQNLDYTLEIKTYSLK